MDSGISDVLNSVLSNPESLNKIMTLMPVVSQMMSNNGGNTTQSAEKPIETAAVNKDIPADNLMANTEVIAAFKNLVTALNGANAAEADAPAFTTPQPQLQQQEAQEKQEPKTVDIDNTKIEKTLETLKNFSSATSPESDHRSKLLLALKPFMKDARKTKIDTAIKYMNAAKIISLFGKNGFV